MKKTRDGVILTVALALAVSAAPLQAQRGGGFRGQLAGPNVGRSLDVLVEKQEALELTEAQLAQVRDLKTAMETDVTPLAEEMKTLREQIRAGEVDRDEGHRQLQGLAGELLTASAPLRGRLQEILTVEQHRKLQAEVWQGRPGRGRGGASQGRAGGRVPRGRLRGVRGGSGPGWGFIGQSGFGQGSIGRGRVHAMGFRRAGLRGAVPAMNRPEQGFRRGGGWSPPLDASKRGNLSSLG